MAALPTGPRLPPAAGGAPRALVVLLHGLGAEGQDLVPLAEAWAPHLPHAEFVAPDAPFPCDTAPFGRQWFRPANWDRDSALAGLRQLEPILEEFLTRELAERGLGGADLALAGFSQGAMSALHIGLRRVPPPAAIVAYSGLLVAPDLLRTELRGRPPVLLVHGEDDPVVPLRFMRLAESALMAEGVPVEARLRPRLGHGIDRVGMAIGRRLLLRALPQASREGVAP